MKKIIAVSLVFAMFAASAMQIGFRMGMWESKSGERPIGGWDGLKFVAEENGVSIRISNADIEIGILTSKNEENWEEYTTENWITLQKDETLYFKAWEKGNHYFLATFETVGILRAEGNIMSLLDGKNFKSLDIEGRDNCFRRAFINCKGLKTAPKLPARIVPRDCYLEMFAGCENLEVAPELPATIVRQGAYFEMFRDCTKLKTTPHLLATNLTQNAYNGMFKGCSSLESAKDLPRPTRITGSYIYKQMFANCTSLTNAPVINIIKGASDFDIQEYVSMFEGCLSLRISENGGEGKKILDLTDDPSIQQSQTYDMFKNTGGTFTGTPTIGNTYWCY